MSTDRSLEFEARARLLDETPDPAFQRDEFTIPVDDAGLPVAYLAGNSLGLRPHRGVAAVHEALESWGRYGVHGHVTGDHPWFPYHEELRAASARLTGARLGEAVVMNSLTVNLHFMLNTFYRPTSERYRIVVEHDAFPSDRYAVESQVALRGYPGGVVPLVPGDGRPGVNVDDVERCLSSLGGTAAVVLLGAVNFRTGAYLDIEGITQVIHSHGALAGWDLAHACGNVPLQMHDWNVDFAVWCSYKYLNSGPGSLGGCFVHDRHGNDPTLLRPSGWWGHDSTSRFSMPEHFAAQPGVEGWQVSNPPILSMAAVRASFELFDEVGMDAIRARSLRLTAFLEEMLDDACVASGRARIVTPRDPSRRGAQLSLEVDNAAQVTEQLSQQYGVIADDRPPNIVRFAPAPLYNTFHDCWRAASAVRSVLGSR